MEMGLPTFPYAIYKTNQHPQSSPRAVEKGGRGMRKRSKKRAFVLDDRHKLAAQIFAQGDFVTMQEVVDTLYDKEVDGRVVIDDDMKKALDAYYAQYGVKAGE